MSRIPRGKFEEGDNALLIDRKGRRYLILLDKHGLFETHVGTLPHKEIIGRDQGAFLNTSGGQSLLILKPTLSDHILGMPRSTQVVYPKDLGAIIVLADIFPGAIVVEAGLGSGALTAVLCRSVGPKGKVVTYELREDLVKMGLENVTQLAFGIENHSLHIGDIYQGINEQNVDRIVLDVPEPWHVIPWAAEALIPGGIILSFLPTILQVHRLAQTLNDHPLFQLVETVEVLVRPWDVSQRSVRPAHRMVAHTGFITTSRRCSNKSDRLPQH